MNNFPPVMKDALKEASNSLRFHAKMIINEMEEQDKDFPNFRGSLACKISNDEVEKKLLYADIIDGYAERNKNESK